MGGIKLLIILFYGTVFASIIYTDLRYRYISNNQNIILLILIIISSYVFDFNLNLYSATIFLIIGIFLFYIGMFGGGDIKLISILVLILNQNELMLFFVFTSIVGAMQAIFAISISKIKKDKSYTQRGVAYGVAIIFGFLMILIIKIFIKG